MRQHSKFSSYYITNLRYQRQVLGKRELTLSIKDKYRAATKVVRQHSKFNHYLTYVS